MNSIEWTDHKSSNALMMLTERRDPALVAVLRSRALPALVEMARWKASHGMAAFFILGRMTDLPDDAIFAAWQRGDRAAVIDRVAAVSSSR